ncbi:hypothetical protein [Janibacter corallicola]|uniref:hypothetical protein n=1 Tax=Janibacter corallicola TaxID=415212 RepID=UPI000830D466|nr:hypothetical protein [Janibacter corallicola]
MDFLGQNPWLVWMFVGLLLVLVEAVLVDFLFVMLATGALCGALTAALGASVLVQVLVAVVVALLLLLLVRPRVLAVRDEGGPHRPR